MVGLPGPRLSVSLCLTFWLGLIFPAFMLLQDGNYFIKLLDENTSEINQLCKEYKVYLELEDQSNPDFITNEEGK